MEPDSVERDSETTLPPQTSPRQATLAGRRILVIDDSRPTLVLVRRLLELAGASKVDCAESATDAVRDYDVQSYDAILIDIQMPDMDGHAAAAKLRALGVRSPLLAMTADDSDESDMRCTDSGFTRRITKPFTPAALTEALAHSV